MNDVLVPFTPANKEMLLKTMNYWLISQEAFKRDFIINDIEWDGKNFIAKLAPAKSEITSDIETLIKGLQVNFPIAKVIYPK